MNPYITPTAVPFTGVADPEGNRWSYRWHFLSFNATFIVFLFGFFCVFSGLTTAFNSLLTEPDSWLIAAVLGIMAWLTHAITLKIFRRLRTRGPSLLGVVGSSAFVAFIFISQIIQDYAPNSISVPWSWTPEHARLAIYTIGSLASVVLFAALTQRRPRIG